MEEEPNIQEEVQNDQPQKEQENTSNDKQEDVDNKTKSHKGRIIIRNLVYDINEGHIKKHFQRFGEIIDVKVPINPATNKAKGFAFVEFDNKNTALKELNGTKFKGRPILLDLAVDKSRYETKKIQPEKEAANLNNNKPQKEKQNGHRRKSDDMKAESEEGEEEEEQEDDAIQGKGKNNGLEEEDDEEEKLEEKRAAKRKENAKKQDLSTTVFVRNISFEVSQSEFRDFFRSFGPIDYAKLVISKATEAHNGNGFVKFKSPAVAKHLCEESQKLEQANLFTKEGTTISDVNLELGGRRVVVLPALERTEVSAIKESRKQKDDEFAPKNKNTLEYWIYQDKHKKRNLYLATYGLNEPQEGFSEADIAKFESNRLEKLEKVKNPNYFVSETRVIFKNLPKRDFDEENLKEVILKILGEKHNAKIIKTRRLVSKISIIREKEREDGEGNFRSRGFGFADFVTHEDALYFLKQIQEQYSLISDKKIPIVEFAIEDVRELKKREKILQKLQSRNKEVVKPEKDPNAKPKEKEANNADKLAKLKLEELLEKGGPDTFPQVQELMRKIKSRGIKQRFKKRVAQKYGLQNQAPKEPKKKEPVLSKLEAKVQKKQNQKNTIKAKLNPAPEDDVEEEVLEKPLKMIDENEELKLIKSIQRMIKNNKRKKRRAEDHDEFDDITDAYQKKLQKI